MPNRKATVKPAKLDIWQQRLADSDVAWKPETDRMDHREHLYNGDRKIRPLVTGDTQADGGQENTPPRPERGIREHREPGVLLDPLPQG